MDFRATDFVSTASSAWIPAFPEPLPIQVGQALPVLWFPLCFIIFHSLGLVSSGTVAWWPATISAGILDSALPSLSWCPTRWIRPGSRAVQWSSCLVMFGPWLGKTQAVSGIWDMSYVPSKKVELMNASQSKLFLCFTSVILPQLQYLYIASSEIFLSGVWSPGPAAPEPLTGASCGLLPGNRVIFAGGLRWIKAAGFSLQVRVKNKIEDKNSKKSLVFVVDPGPRFYQFH